VTLSAADRRARHRRNLGLPVDVDRCEACGHTPKGKTRVVSRAGLIADSADGDLAAVCGLCAAVTILAGELAGKLAWHPAATKLRAGLLGAASAALRETRPVSDGSTPSVGGGVSAGADAPSPLPAVLDRSIQTGASLADLRRKLEAAR